MRTSAISAPARAGSVSAIRIASSLFTAISERLWPRRSCRSREKRSRSSVTARRATASRAAYASRCMSHMRRWYRLTHAANPQVRKKTTKKKGKIVYQRRSPSSSLRQAASVANAAQNAAVPAHRATIWLRVTGDSTSAVAQNTGMTLQAALVSIIGHRAAVIAPLRTTSRRDAPPSRPVRTSRM
ncbi:hypothetical protein BJF79_35945 [Actinomadura sp. CNU-125]|nr:hypothetical protein [Actinomadura sp. CNU-125]OLT32619.1 hypothetical protein BJF79_35945 [Actinomadura sp. CNU-125]